MADYVSILDKAVSGLSDNSPETRAIIYEKARAAIERKLRAMDPVPAEPAIARQMEQLEAAIYDVEARYQVPVESGPVPEAEPELVHEIPEATAPFAPVEIPVAQEPEQPAQITVPEGFVDEPILIDGIGEKTAKLLAEQGVTRISQIAAMSDAKLANLTAAIGYPGFEITQEWKRQSLDMLGGQLPRGKTNQDRLAKLVLEAEVQSQELFVEEKPQEPPVANLPENQMAEPAVAETISEDEPAATPAAPAAATPHDDDYQAFLEAFANTEKQERSSPDTAPSAESAPAEPAPVEAPQETQEAREPFRPQVPVFDEPVLPQSAALVDQVIPPAPDIDTMALPEEPVTHTPVPDPAQRPERPKAPSSPDFVSKLDNDPQIDPQDRQVRSGRDSRPVRRPLSSSSPKKGNGGNIAAAGVIVLLLGAVAAGAYYFREPIMDIGQKGVVAVRALLDVDEPAGNAPANNAEAVEPQSGEPAKDTSRLGNGDSEPEPAPVAVEAIEPKPVAPETVEPTAPTVDAEPAAPATVEVQEEPGGDSAPADAANNADAGSDADTNVAEGTGDSAGEPTANNSEASSQASNIAVLTGEKSYLYEEAAGSTGASRDEGSMAWSLVSEPPEAGAPAEPVIKGVMEIPSRGLILNLSIKRNVDPALSASHLIELIFTAPSEFSGGNVDNISRFVMKSNEQARGESLVGVPARIDTGYFLIALNNLDQALKTNLNLLENGNWVDIPVAYVTGRRALITFEKGASGKEVFSQALADWKNR